MTDLPSARKQGLSSSSGPVTQKTGLRASRETESFLHGSGPRTWPTSTMGASPTAPSNLRRLQARVRRIIIPTRRARYTHYETRRLTGGTAVKERAWDFREVGRLPAPGDNVAMATRRLEAGTRVSHGGSEFTVGHTVLEGHRFAVEPISEGEDLLSWGLRFGRAVRDMAPGDYACNGKILKVLAERHMGFELPPEPNFSDAELDPYVLDEEGFRPGEQVPLRDEPRTFMGYRRGPGRGVGTRNYVVLMGVT